jgi:hypothetical protein
MGATRRAVATALAAVFIVVSPSVASAQTNPGTFNPPGTQGFDPANFSHPNKINHEFVPLVPGTEYTWEGERTIDGVVVAHSVMFTITDLTKVIDGVRATVIWERDFDGGGLSESELAFNAQDDNGKVWNLGEYPEVYEGGQLVGAPDTWIAGLRDAIPGVLLHPHPGTYAHTYSEGYAPRIEFFDRAKVVSIDGYRCVPLGCFDNVLEIDEWGPFAPEDDHQRKFYAPGVGPIYVTPVGGEAELLQLVKVEHLNDHELRDVRHEALKLDHRGLRKNNLYARTPPAVPLDDC